VDSDSIGPIANVFSYDSNDYLTSTGEWSIQNDNLGRIQQATGHGVRTLHGHDDFGNNIYHQASPSPAPPSSMPPSTMISWEFPPLLDNRIPTVTDNGAQTWWQYRKNGDASWIGKTAGGDKIQLDWDGLGLLKAISDTVGNTINARHDFTYAPSGLRIRDKRTGAGRVELLGRRSYNFMIGGATCQAIANGQPSNIKRARWTPSAENTGQKC